MLIEEDLNVAFMIWMPN